MTNLTADEAALLAAMVVAPTSLAELLVTQPAVVAARRNLVLKDMYQQGYLTQAEYLADIQVSLPPAAAIQSPSEEATNKSAGYFIRWIEPELFAKYGTKLYSAGYTIHTTLDYSLQEAAQSVVDQTLPPGSGGPAAALVAIDNKTGEVKAMVGGLRLCQEPVQSRHAGRAPARVGLQGVRLGRRPQRRIHRDQAAVPLGSLHL